MKRLSLFLSLTLTLTILLPSLGFANPCPKDWRHERSGILHDSPKKRLFGGKSSGGRVCLDLRKPVSAPRAGGGYKVVCPDGYSNERRGIFHDSPKKRLLDNKNSLDGRTCLAVIKPGSSPAGKPWIPRESGKPVMRYLRGAQVTVGRGIFVRYKATDPSHAVCAARCQQDKLCVATNYSNSSKSCTVLGQYNWHQGDRLKSSFNYGAQVKPGAGWASFKNSKFRGKVDYRPMIKVTTGKCVEPRFYATNGSTKIGPPPHELSNNTAQSCLFDTHCIYAQINKGQRNKRTYHQKAPATSNLTSGSCTGYKIRRSPKPKTSGGRG